MNRIEATHQLWQRFEPLHAVSYFASESREGFKNAGYRGYWMAYFASRAAPLGAAGADLVVATFYNFSAAHVAKAIPDAWSFAPPATALDVRLDTGSAALRRIFAAAELDTSGTSMHRAGELLRRAAESAPVDGRALFAANHQLPWPDDPVAVVWHASTLLREHRGDGHIAALVSAGIGGRESGVLNALYRGGNKEVLAVMRNYDDQEWDETIAALSARGWVTDERLTTAGRTTRDDLERRTDELGATAYGSLADDELDELAALLEPLAAAVVASGELPQQVSSQVGNR